MSRASCCPSKLSYFGSTDLDGSECRSKDVFLREKGKPKAFSWELRAVNEKEGIYVMFAKVCVTIYPYICVNNCVFMDMKYFAGPSEMQCGRESLDQTCTRECAESHKVLEFFSAIVSDKIRWIVLEIYSY